MITAKEAEQLTRKANNFYEKYKYYEELIDIGIREAANDKKRSIIITIDSYDVAKTLANELCSKGFFVAWTDTILSIRW